MNPEFDIVDYYGTIVYTMIFSATYNDFLPWGACVALLSLVIIYFVSKVCLN